MVLGAIAAVFVLGIVVAALLLVFGGRRFSQDLEEQDVDSVDVAECETDDDGFMTARLRVLNLSSQISDYAIEITFDGVGGDTVATAEARVDGVPPGHVAEVDASSGEPPSGEFECRVESVERQSAEG